MEILSNGLSGNRLQVTQPSFAVASDLHQGSAFDLLLSLPTVASTSVEPTPVDEPPNENRSDEATCVDCQTESEQPAESESTEQSDSTTDKSASAESTQADIVASTATIDAVAAQQIQTLEQSAAIDPKQGYLSEPTKLAVTQEPVDASQQPLTEADLAEAANDSNPADLTSSFTKRSELKGGKASAEETNSAALVSSNDLPSNPQGKSSDDGGRHAVEAARQSTENLAIEPELSEPVATPEIAQASTNQHVKNVREGASGPQIESVRRGPVKDRPARWYERDSKESPAAIAEDNFALNAAPDGSSVDATKPSNPPDSSAQDISPQGASQTQSNSETFGFELTEALKDVSVFEHASSSGLTSTSAVSSLADATQNNFNELTRSLGLGTEGLRTERTNSKLPLGSNDQLESSQTGPQVDLTRAEKTRLLQRVARSFSRLGPSGGNMQIKLHPPELGALAVQVRIEGRSMAARLTTESQAAKEVIMESLPQLRSRLAEQGYDIVQFSVDVASDSSSLGDQPGAGQAGQGGQSGNSDGSERRGQPVDLRRSQYLRRQLDEATGFSRAPQSHHVAQGVDLQV